MATGKCGVDRTNPHPGKLGHLQYRVVICLATAITLFLLSLFPEPLQADTPSTCVLKWGTIDTPGSFPQRNDIITPCEVNDMAVSADGKIIYALDIPNSSTGPVVNAGIYRSEDGGISWSPRPTQWLARIPSPPAPTFPLSDIAIAPDNPDFIAAVCMDVAGTRRKEVYYSEDGGTNWHYSGSIPWLYGSDEQVGSIAVSPPCTYQGIQVHDIIIGSRKPSDGQAQGEIYVYRYPGISGWQAQGFAGGDIITLHPSPAYSSDSTLVIMASTTQRTYINLGSRDFAANTCSFNTVPNWPVELCTPDQAGGANSGEAHIVTGSLSLPSDFDGGASARRIIFTAYDSNGASLGAGRTLDDVYRLNDSMVTRLKVPAGKPRISSIAYHGTTKSGKLLAGSVTADPLTAAATLWFTSSPLAQCPTWVKPLKSPTGGYGSGFANVIVAWDEDGQTALAGTGSGNRDTPLKWSDPNDPSWASQALDESAFSVGLDDGASWNQLGLIDTQVNRYRALAVAEDGKTIYLSSVNDNGLDSAWRSRTPIIGDAWQRVACLDISAPLLRLPPDKKDGSTLFLGNQATTRIIQSRDGGHTWNDCLPGALLQDIAAKSSDEMYVLQANALVRHGKYESGGWIWDKFTDTGLLSAHTITVQGNNVAAGAAIGQQCPLSYSLDGGKDWILISEPAYSSGNRHVAFDEEFKDNHLIYLADDAGGCYRWAVGTSNRWDDMTPTSNSYYGIAPAPSGVIYAAYSPLTTKGVDRSLWSRGGIPKLGVFWDSLTTGLSSGVVFRLEPSALVSADETIWAVDARDYDPFNSIGRLWAFKDTLANHSPWLISPKGNSLVYCDPVTGRNAQVDLTWEQLSLAEAYDVEIGKDKWFDLVVTGAAPATVPFYVPNDLLYPAYYIGAGLLPEAGHTYFWHVRVKRSATGQVIRSRWSYALSFTVRSGFPVVAPSYPGIQSLQPGPEACAVPAYPLGFSWTPLQGITSYHFVLSRDPGLSQPVIDQAVNATAYKLPWRLDYQTAYFWQVTPVEPIPGDPSPVFAFTTQHEPAQPVQAGLPPDNTLKGLLAAAIVVMLFAVSYLVIRDRNK